MHELRIGIAGFGVVGKRRNRCISTLPHVKVVAVSDKTFANDHMAEEFVCLDDYRKLYNEKMDALFVCLTNDVASDAVIMGLENGLHVFCEKPPGRNLADVTSVLECKKKYPQLKLMYGFNHRYHSSVQEALKIVRSGELGKILNLSGVYGKSKLITFNQSDWRTKKKLQAVVFY